MRYVLLLRGINVGGKNKVMMAELKSKIEALGYDNVSSYINSGNLFFDSEDSLEDIQDKIQTLLNATYDFKLVFIIINADTFKEEYSRLPEWWWGELARKDVLFYTDSVDKEALKQTIQAMSFGDEIIHFGNIAAYWGKYSEANYKKTAYAKYLMKTPFYKQITIRNGKTFRQIYQKLME